MKDLGIHIVIDSESSRDRDAEFDDIGGYP